MDAPHDNPDDPDDRFDYHGLLVAFSPATGTYALTDSGYQMPLGTVQLDDLGGPGAVLVVDHEHCSFLDAGTTRALYELLADINAGLAESIGSRWASETPIS